MVQLPETLGEYRDDGMTMHRLLEIQVEKTPDTVAVVFEDKRLTYRELNARANGVAQLLRSRHEAHYGTSLKPDTLVALYFDRSLEMIISIFGVLKAGGAYVPISPEYPEERVRFILNDTNAPILLTQERYLKKLDALVLKPDGRFFNLALDSPEAHALYQHSNLGETSSSKDLAYVIYTSGSTGNPKGVAIEHRSIISSSYCRLMTYPDCRVFLLVSDYVFDSSIAGITVSLFQGGTLVLAKNHEASHILELVVKEGVTHTLLTPSLYSVLVETISKWFGRLKLKAVTLAGEKLTRNVYEQHNQFPNGVKLFNEYGPTENSVWATIGECDQAETCHFIGKPIANSRLYILDDLRQPVAAGEIGELYISGMGLARQYLNLPEVTASYFIDNPFASHEDKAKGHGRLYRTGDMVRCHQDGILEYIGRKDRQVKISGYRIELEEVEAVIEKLAHVKHAIVLNLEHNGAIHLVAYVVPESVGLFEADILSDELKSRLPHYMVPSAFVFIDSIPLTINGKPDHGALPSPKWESDCVYVQPRNELEQGLCRIWESVLGFERVGINDNFFRMGGTSIAAIRITAACSRELGVELPLSLLMERKTIAAIAPHLSTHEAMTIPRAVVEQYPLSFPQESQLFIENSSQIPGIYHIPYIMKINEGARWEALKESLSYVIARHSILNTVYSVSETGNVYQSISNSPADLGTEQLLSEADLLIAVKNEVKRRFNLNSEPPIRMRRYLISDAQYLLIVLHHIAFDGWSVEIFFNELKEAYTTLCAGLRPSLPDLEISYADYAVWQRNYLQGDNLDRLSRYWQTVLSGCETLALPTDHPRPGLPDYQGRNSCLQLSLGLSNRLRDFAKNQDTTLYTVLLSGFYIALATLSGQDDIVVGTPSDNRLLSQTQGMIGFFVNPLVLRASIQPDESIKDFVRRVHSIVVSAKVHQDYPFQKLVTLLDVERDPSMHPLFQIMFGAQSFDIQDNIISGLPLSLIAGMSEQICNDAKFDISLFFDDRVPQLSLVFNYAVSLFEAGTIRRIQEIYLRILEAFCDDPLRVINEINILSEEERRIVLFEWSGVNKDYPADRTLFELVEEQAEKSPENIAILSEGKELTYRELNQSANRLARLIHKTYKSSTGAVLKPSTLIALYFDRSIEMVISMLAILKAGGAYVPISPTLPKNRAHFIFNDTGVHLVLTQKRHLERLNDWFGDKHRRPNVIATDSIDSKEQFESTNLMRQSGPKDLAYVMYTSGSTGKPKGALICQRGVISLVQNNDYVNISSTDTFLQFSTPSFDASTFEIWGALTNGAKLVLPGPRENFDVYEIEKLLQGFEISILFVTTSLFRALYLERPNLFRSLQYLIVGGEQLNASSIAALLVQEKAPRNILNAYGPTECTTFTTTCRFDCSIDPVPIGRPINARKVYILSRDLKPVPIGNPGELYIGGPGVALGYLNQPQLTAEKFIDNPYATEEDKARDCARLYRTGDIVRWLPDGNIQFLYRNDLQVKIRGFRVEPGEIESIISSLPGVRQVAVTVRKHGGHNHLVSYIVPEHGAAVEAERIREDLRLHLPEYMIPTAFIFIDKIPLTANGKLDVAALPEPNFVDTHPFVEGRNELEKQLCIIWKELLGVDRVGIHDNFFRLGGDSISAVRLTAICQERLNVYIPIKLMLEEMNIAGIVKHLSETGDSYPARIGKINERKEQQKIKIKL
jgi:amino acid adenylation domain-containing protein